MTKVDLEQDKIMCISKVGAELTLEDVNSMQEKTSLLIEPRGGILIISAGQGRKNIADEIVLLMTELANIEEQKKRARFENLAKLIENMASMREEKDNMIINEDMMLRVDSNFLDLLMGVSLMPMDDFCLRSVFRGINTKLHPAERRESPDKIIKPIRTMSRNLVKHMPTFRNKSF
ncbi:MAG: hypothetical protein Q8880_12990 [Bacteroidota bacterium]|nr:hypothetical protein [Bacteroidota bacterium]